MDKSEEKYGEKKESEALYITMFIYIDTYLSEYLRKSCSSPDECILSKRMGSWFLYGDIYCFLFCIEFFLII